jgi:DnaJ-class molecular chaperone
MKKTCDGCGGSGQTGSFQGESRFIITWEECPECCGTGFVEEDAAPVERSEDHPGRDTT